MQISFNFFQCSSVQQYWLDYQHKYKYYYHHCNRHYSQLSQRNQKTFGQPPKLLLIIKVIFFVYSSTFRDSPLRSSAVFFPSFSSSSILHEPFAFPKAYLFCFLLFHQSYCCSFYWWICVILLSFLQIFTQNYSKSFPQIDASQSLEQMAAV